MRADFKSPGLFKGSLIEWKARQIPDPIQKLAYLQRAANARASSRRLRVSWYAKMALLLLVFLGSKVQPVTNVNAGLPREKHISKAPGLQHNTPPSKAIWLVDQEPDYEVYSNGLRVENRFCKPNEPRFYVIFHNELPSETAGDLRSKPAGIVFHTSESVQAPFMPKHNDTLTRIGTELLEFVSRHRSYHFLVDRFGRVFRVVPETDVANHAGYSVWADTEGVYVNLNHCFLGISFEAHTHDIDEGYYLNSAQIHSGRLLVEMLVRKYEIPLRNCVTHAQVSVDPKTMVIGHHTDGSWNFPFQELGIPDNYSLPLPSLYAFGFDFDTHFLIATGTRMWKGLLLADERLRRESKLQNLSVGQYKQTLRERYRTSIATLKSLGVLKEN